MNKRPEQHFNSVSEWLDFNSKLATDDPYNQGAEWNGKLKRDDILKRARYGDLSLMDQVNALTEKLHLPDTEGKDWISSVSGPIFCIPEVIAGYPENARRLDISESERAPIRIFVNPFLSASVTLEQGLKRGITIAALASRLQMTHPVELVLVAAHGTWGGKDPSSIWNLITVNIGVLPIDMSVLAFLLARPEVYRRLMLPVSHDMGMSSWDSKAAGPEAIKSKLGLTEHDLYIGALVLGDKLMTSPIEWINEQVERFNKGE